MKRPVVAIVMAAVLVVAAVVALLFIQAREPRVAGPGGFDLFAFFEGTSTSRGTITTMLVRTEAFTARFAGRRQGEAFRLEERFSFEDGERLQVWTLGAVPGGYAGTVETEREDGSLAAPVPVEGSADASGVRLAYDGIAPGGGAPLRFRHHMRMRDDGTVDNHVVVSRFDIPLATSSVTFAGQADTLPSPSGAR